MKIEVNKNVVLFEMLDMVQKAASAINNKAHTADLNGTRDKILNNGGMLTGAAIGGGAMLDHMVNDGSIGDIGTAIIGAGVMGTAGGAIGQMLHNQIKKNNTDTYQTDNFRNY